MVVPGIELRTSGLAARNSDYTTEAVNGLLLLLLLLAVN
jgi:hypothetical protein